MGKSPDEMSIEELKIKAYDVLVLINRLQVELSQIQQIIINKTN